MKYEYFNNKSLYLHYNQFRKRLNQLFFKMLKIDIKKNIDIDKEGINENTHSFLLFF